MSYNIDLRGFYRGQCSCGQCDEFLLRNKEDLSHNGWCNYCNHPPTDHQLLKNPELYASFVPVAESTYIDVSAIGEIPSTSSVRDETQVLLYEEMLDEARVDSPGEEEHVDSPKSPIKSKNKKNETTRLKKNFPLPTFSNVVQPLLHGDILSAKDHAQLSSILKDEIITFLNHENIICEGNTATLRWEYRNLGLSLAEKYPKMLWDLPSNRQKKQQKENAPIYAVFIRRLSQRRKMQRLRQKTKERKGLPFVVEVVENKVEVSPEDAISELKLVTPETIKNGVNIERIKELLQISYEKRKKDDLSELPAFLMVQTCLETEVELRLGSSMAEQEKKLSDVLKKMASKYLVPGTILELEKLMRPKRATWSAITMGEYSPEQMRPGPSFFFGNRKVLLAGDQVIHLEEDCQLERGTILLLGLYFILNLNFPSAYGQFLGLLQNVLVKGEKFSKSFSSNHLLQVTKRLTE